MLTPYPQYPIVAQCLNATPHYHSCCLAALCRTLAAISTALASLLANETTAKCCQTNLLLVAVPCSLNVYGTQLTKLSNNLCPSSVWVAGPVDTVLAEGRSTFVAVVVERHIVVDHSLGRLGGRSCENGVSIFH